MPTTVTCAQGHALRADDHLAGRTLACPVCQSPVIVPRVGGAAAESAPAAGASRSAAAPNPSLAQPAAKKPATGPSVQVVCPNGHKITVGAKYFGQRAACPKCKAAIQVPQPAPEPAVEQLEAWSEFPAADPLGAGSGSTLEGFGDLGDLSGLPAFDPLAAPAAGAFPSHFPAGGGVTSGPSMAAYPGVPTSASTSAASELKRSTMSALLAAIGGTCTGLAITVGFGLWLFLA